MRRQTLILFALLLLAGCTDNSVSDNERYFDTEGCTAGTWPCVGSICSRTGRDPGGADCGEHSELIACPEKVCVEGRYCRKRGHLE